MTYSKNSKANQSFSIPDDLLSQLDAHIKVLSRCFNPIEKSHWICQAIRTQMAIDLARDPEQWRKVYQDDE